MMSGERIINISAAGIRVSVLTDTGRIATFLDESIGKYLRINVDVIKLKYAEFKVKKKQYTLFEP